MKPAKNKMSASVSLLNAALDDEKGEVVIRGQIDPASLGRIKVPPYQRETLAVKVIRTLAEAMKNGAKIPDVCLGMRGSEIHQQGSNILLLDDVYIVDGLQRRTAALEVVATGDQPRLGAKVYLNTDEASERALFRHLNQDRARLSSNVLLRNLWHDNEFVALLCDLCKDNSFVLYDRVSWDQRMKRSDLVTAVGLLKIVAHLHTGFRPGLTQLQFEPLAQKMQDLLAQIGRKALRENIKTFWHIMDEVFGIRNVTYKEGAVHLRQGFCVALALVFAGHLDFWKGYELMVPADIRKKLSLFHIDDKQIASLSAANVGGPSNAILCDLIVRHINSGRRTSRLTVFGAKPTRTARAMRQEENDDGEESAPPPPLRPNGQYKEHSKSAN